MCIITSRSPTDEAQYLVLRKREENEKYQLRGEKKTVTDHEEQKTRNRTVGNITTETVNNRM